MLKNLQYPVMLVIAFLTVVMVRAQGLYFPPSVGQWDTVPSAELNWCEDSLITLNQFLDDHHSKAFIILKGGRIATEWYYDQFTRDSIWYWASAAKGLSAMMVGIAQEEGHLKISDTTSTYLGSGWTNCTPAEEAQITIQHQLTMTSGLDDRLLTADCTIDTCLNFKAIPGTRWAYHNAPYTLLREVVEQASGETYNNFFQQRIGQPTGMQGLWSYVGFNNLFLSTARTMARYGLLIQAGGRWNGTPILGDTTYFDQMINTSQGLNKSYGYLWWLNGKGEYMLPGLQLKFNQDLIPNAPDDLVAALGKNDQKIYVVPSLDMVVIRMGNKADNSLLALSPFDNELWGKIMGLECNKVGLRDYNGPRSIVVYPNPVQDRLEIRIEGVVQSGRIFNAMGQMVLEFEGASVDFSKQNSGWYWVEIQTDEGVLWRTQVVKE